MKSILVGLFLLSFSGAWAATTHSKLIEKTYMRPVSSSKAIVDLETEAKAFILATCKAETVTAKKFIVSIPFDEFDFTFNPTGTPGSVDNPVFMHFSYPTVQALLEFTCE